MAFHQPLQQRLVRVDTEPRESQDLAPQVLSGPDQSQTWVLFSPATDAGTTTSYLSSVQTTAGRSRISDLGSLGTLARSDINSQPNNSAVPSDYPEESIVEDDGELDSLDSHLPEFRTVPNLYNQQGVFDGAPVFPSHDGLGSFRFDAQGMSLEAQERLYAFERFNPRRFKRRRESLDRAQLELENEDVQESDRNRRIEAWRLQQSQLLLSEIQKETRKRRQSDASASRQQPPTAKMATEPAASEMTHDIQLNANDWHEQDSPELATPHEGLWSRITRKFIRDLIGIDDKMLSVLFGEALPEDEDISSTPKATNMSASTPALAHDSESLYDSTWQLHILERIARELGLLVHHMSSQHPGAFSTYKRVQQAPLPYAGLPVIPEGGVDANESLDRKPEDSVPSMPQFRPTVAQPIDIPGARPTEPMDATVSMLEEATPTNNPHAFTQQEWEQDLDIKLVFRYLRSRFSSSRSSSPPFTSGTSHLATSSTQDAAARAARVRMHHPLVSHSHSHSHPHSHQRSRPAERRAFKATTPSSPVALRHASGSCASQSTRRSTRRSSVSSRHSSRHYWDIGGSIGTGSIVASTGPMGSWGEI